ncbi:MAG: glycosyltransferase family 4 protein, partial [Acidobacteriota bacterium]
LARALQGRGHEVLLLARAGTPAAERGRQAGLEVDTRFDFRTGRLTRDLTRMVTLLRSRPFDVLNPHRAGDQNVLLIARRLSRLRTPILRTRVDVKEFRPNLANVLVYNYLMSGIVAPGDRSRKLIMEHYRIKASHIETVHAGVDTDRFSPRLRDDAMRQSLGIGEGVVAYGIVARLGTIKGHVHFFEAIRKLRDARRTAGAGPEMAFLVIGPETDYTIAELRAMAEQIGAGPIIFTGYRADIERVTAALDVGVVTSVGSEAHCRVGLEMLASGVPVIGTDVGVIPELIDEGVTGYVVKPQDPAALYERMSLLLDPERRACFSAAARDSVMARFTFEKFAARTEEAFDALAFEGRSRQPVSAEVEAAVRL